MKIKFIMSLSLSNSVCLKERDESERASTRRNGIGACLPCNAIQLNRCAKIDIADIIT